MSQTTVQTETKAVAYSKSQLAILYRVSEYTFRNWVKTKVPDLGEYIGGAYTPQQVKLIFEKLGEP